MALRATGWRVAAVQLLGVSQPRVNNLLIGQLDLLATGKQRHSALFWVWGYGI
jgi:hypothetical protein